MLFFAFRYYWQVARGHRLRPWRSPYLRWRLETFFGVHAEAVTRGEFSRLLWRERRRLVAFLRWAEEMEKRQRRSEPPFDSGRLEA
jgi:hypothetical protein